jgi:hypothetical protein
MAADKVVPQSKLRVSWKKALASGTETSIVIAAHIVVASESHWLILVCFCD